VDRALWWRLEEREARQALDWLVAEHQGATRKIDAVRGCDLGVAHLAVLGCQLYSAVHDRALDEGRVERLLCDLVARGAALEAPARVWLNDVSTPFASPLDLACHLHEDEQLQDLVIHGLISAGARWDLVKREYFRSRVVIERHPRVLAGRLAGVARQHRGSEGLQDTDTGVRAL
jgi:hypothetical protein